MIQWGARGSALLAASAVVALTLGAGLVADTSSGARPNATSPGGSGLPVRLPPSRGRVYYIAPSGSDQNSGTRTRPWRTIQKALATLKPGEKAFVRAGTYTQSLALERRSGTASAPITIAAYAGETAVIHSTGAALLRVSYGSSYWRFQGLVFEATSELPTGTGQPGVWVSDSPGANGLRSRAIEFRSCEFRGNQHNSSAFLANPQTNAVHLIGNRSHGWGNGTHQRHGIYFQGQNGLIANNVIYDNDGFGIVVRGNDPEEDGGVRIPSRNAVVVHNTLVDNGLTGIGIENSATGVTVVNNIAAFNGVYGISGYDESGEVLPGNVAFNNLGFGNRNGQFHSDGRILDFSGGNLVADPRFVDKAARNYRLRATSPGLNRAKSRYSLSSAYGGQPRLRRSRPDIGAYER